MASGNPGYGLYRKVYEENWQKRQAFYLTGEVETYGTGFIRIRHMLEPDTELQLQEQGDFFIACLKKTTQKITQKTTQKISTQQQIIDLIKQYPQTTRQDMSKMLGKSESTIKEHLSKMKNRGLIVCVGSDRSGHWETA